MAPLIETSRFIPSAPPLSPVQSLEEAFIEVGLRSPNEHVQRIARNYITPKQPNLVTKCKTFFAEKWSATKAYPQAGVNKVKQVFHSIYQHPTLPYVGAGLLGATTGLLMGLSIPAGFMLGVAIKLGSIALDKGLDAVNRVFHKVFKLPDENISQSSFNQTMRAVPFPVLGFCLGLNSYHLVLAAKIAAAAVIIGSGALAIGIAFSKSSHATPYA
ncbi:MAG: hypothetical protein LBC45_03215 [Chlamydiales bacterium]|jgi:hypothetical protein|nr:hypothetical protein [Chlamydiales bacterium]